MKTLYETLEMLALNEGMTVRQLALKSKIAPGSIYRWKTMKPHPSTLKKVADTLNYDIQELSKLPIEVEKL